MKVIRGIRHKIAFGSGGWEMLSYVMDELRGIAEVDMLDDRFVTHGKIIALLDKLDGMMEENSIKLEK